MTGLARGNSDDLRRAKILADAFVYVLNNDRHYTDGRLRNAYMSGDLADHQTGKARIPGWWDPVDEKWYEDKYQVSTHTGNMAWAMIALLNYYKAIGGDQYLEAAITLGEWVERETRDGRGVGGYTGGYEGWEPDPIKIKWKSSEHNIDLYVSFMLLYNITGEEIWEERALHAKGFVEAMWDENGEYFWTGTLEDGVTINDSNIPVDIQAWAVMAMGGYCSALRWAENNAYTEQDGFKCFDFNNDRDGCWFEGTAQMAVAYQINGEGDKSDKYINEMRKAQVSANNANGKGIVAASHDGVTTGFDWEYYSRVHIGATAWYMFAEMQYNPYWGTTTQTVPGSLSPAAPENPSPADGAGGVSLDAGLDWADADNATGYKVYFDVSNPPTALICEGTSVSNCDPGPLVCGTEYYWKVVAKNACGSTEGAVWRFTTLGQVDDCDGDGYDVIQDCDDNDSQINPGVTEICDGIDNNCDDDVDEGGNGLCDDSNVCTDDTCDGTNGCRYVNNTALCDDELFCTENDVCLGGICGGQAKGCDDGVSCTNDICNEATDSCDNTPDDSACDDGLWCNGTETCDPANDCQAGVAPNCSDGVGCTEDTCDEINDQCVNTADNANCDDGIGCTVDTCDPVYDCRYTPADTNCDDSNLCTDDICDPSAVDADGCLFNEINGCYNIPTSAGEGITIPDSPVPGLDLNEIWFESVDNPGVTTVETWKTDDTDLQLPANFDLAGSYFDISTTAVFSGRVEVCIYYDDSNLQGRPEEDLELLHFNTDADPNHWESTEDQTLDLDNNIICGFVTGLSPFAPASPPSDPDVDGDGSPQSQDCDDNDPNRTPGKDEVCGDEIDNNCDGQIDEGCTSSSSSTQAADGGEGGGGKSGCSLTRVGNSMSTCSIIVNVLIMLLPLIIIIIGRRRAKPFPYLSLRR